MIALWMAYSVLIATLLMFGASLMERVSLGAGRSARLPWIFAMGATVVLSATVLLKTTITELQPSAGAAPFNGGIAGGSMMQPADDQLRSHAATPSVIGLEASTLAADPLLQPTAAQLYAFRPATSESPGLAAQLWTWVSQKRDFTAADRTLLALWALMTGASLVFLLVSFLRLNRKRGSWHRALYGDTPILVTDGVGPAVVGIMKGEIAVPAWLFELDKSKQQLVIEHEKQHLLARDQLSTMGGLLSVELYPWNPVLWMMLQRLRRSTEMDCDGRVLSSRVDARV
jgi:hypothetical protein